MAAPVPSLLDAFAQMSDPRKPRGVRHPFPSICALAFLGVLGRATDFACLQRWAADPGRVRNDALGFTRTKPPHATTIRRALARFAREPFRDACARWLVTLPQATAATVAVEGTTTKPGHDAQGDPVPRLHVFAHEVGLGLAPVPGTDGQPTEPQALTAALAALTGHDPMLRLVTADALFTERPLPRVLLEADRDFRRAVQDNQPDRHDAVRASVRDAADRPPDAKSTANTGAPSRPAGSGSGRARRSPRSAKRPPSPASR